MTAPVIPTAAPATPTVPAPVAPAIAPETAAVVAPPTETVEPNVPGGLSGMIDKITHNVTAESLNEPTEPLGGAEAPVVEGAVAPLVEAPADGTPPVMVSAITADEPEGEVVLRARDPKTGQFSDMDQTRTYELSIRDKQTGETKVYNKTLPDLMRLAKDGVAMQKSHGELKYYRENLPAWQETHQQTEQRAQSLEALALELLTADEATVIARREAYASEQTPEKQLARRQAELDAREARLTQDTQRRQQTARQQQVMQQATALASSVGPIVDEARSLVGAEAAAGKLALDTAHLMVNGQIPPERFPQFKAYVEGPYRAWAQGEAAKRSTVQQLQTQTQAELEAAQRTRQQAQLAARSVGSATRPTGGMASNAPAPQGKPKNMNDAIARIVSGNGRPIAASA